MSNNVDTEQCRHFFGLCDCHESLCHGAYDGMSYRTEIVKGGNYDVGTWFDDQRDSDLIIGQESYITSDKFNDHSLY